MDHNSSNYPATRGRDTFAEIKTRALMLTIAGGIILAFFGLIAIGLGLRIIIVAVTGIGRLFGSMFNGIISIILLPVQPSRREIVQQSMKPQPVLTVRADGTRELPRSIPALLAMLDRMVDWIFRPHPDKL
jgi:hypothetical protein